jgi:hypothetical protein
MANTNTLTNAIPQILAQGLVALREACVMPSLVNSDYGSAAAEQGSTVDVPIPSAITVQNVTPSNTPPDDAGVTPTKAQISLSKWKEAPFFLSDKDLHDAFNGIIPMQASEAIKAVANQVNSDIFAEYLGVYGYAGDTSDTPFNSTDGTGDATTARKILNKQLAPLGDRRAVIDPDAEANALNLRAFQDYSFSGSVEGIRDGQINRKLGFNWFMDQLVPTHTTGTLSNGSTHTAKVNDAAYTVGESTVDIDETTLTGTVVKGDIFTVAGDSQTYVVTANATASGNAIAGLAFYPPSKVAWADDAVVTFQASHVVNLAFHRDAFAFASRPLEDRMDAQLGSIIQAATDPISGLSLRLEVTRQHKRIRWAYDILYGAKLIRPELATRIAGKVV